VSQLDPHKDQPVRHLGEPLAGAHGLVILLHGRGASAEDILGLSRELAHPGLAYLAPQAANHTWYPTSFLAPQVENEPYLTSALAKVKSIGTDEEVSASTRPALLAGTPGLLFSGDPDPHVPWSRVEQSAAILEAMGADITIKRYPNRPHTVTRDELDLANQLVAAIAR
jgi:phospholipase/carboxylesterase